jgi:Sec-independent protein secretion pathway component TatC
VRFGGLVPFIPFWLFLYWKFTTQPPDIPERYAFESAMVMMALFGVGYLLAFTFFVPLRKKEFRGLAKTQNP